MGVLFAAFLRAPMTSVFMVLEVSGNYSIIVPVIVANTLAYVISRGLQPTPIFDLLTRQDGLDLPSLEEQREQTVLARGRCHESRADSGIGSRGFRGSGVTPGAGFARNFSRPHEPQRVGQRDRRHAETAGRRRQGGNDVGLDLAHRNLPYLHPDQTLETALRYVYQVPLVPVVHRADFRRLEGVISRDKVLEKYKEQEED